MANFYSQEKSKYGTLSGTIIIWPVEYNIDPVSTENKEILPAGYLKCDGTIYSAQAYPQLAEILDVGTATRFLKRNLDGTPTYEVKDTQFVVPDLGSKFPRPVPGPDAGTYNNILVKNSVGTQITKSGIGITAESVVGTRIRISYSGKFSIPSHTISVIGKSAWNSGANNLKITDKEAVESSSIHSHMHFSTTKRCRIKSSNVTNPLIEPSTGANYYKTGTTVNLTPWLAATTRSDISTPGSNQPACWAIASNDMARATAGSTNPRKSNRTILNITDEFFLVNACWNQNADLLSELRYYCLLPTSGGITYNFTNTGYFSNDKPITRRYINNKSVLAGCSAVLNIDVGSGTVPPTYTSGTAQSDWKGYSLSDTVPLNSNYASSQTQGYSQIENVLTEVDSPYTLYPDGDPTIHSHAILLTKEEQKYTIITEPVLVEPDALNTQLTLSPTTAVSLDAVSSPYIVMEYLIKI